MFRITSLFQPPKPKRRRSKLISELRSWSISEITGATARKNCVEGEEDDNSTRARPLVVFASELLPELLPTIQVQIHRPNSTRFHFSALAFGSAIHESVAAYYQTKLEGDELRAGSNAGCLPG